MVGKQNEERQKGHALWPVSIVMTVAVVLAGLTVTGAPSAGVTSSASYARWSISPSPNVPGADSTLWSTSCVGSSFCMAVGNSDTNRVLSPLAELWNGSAWLVLSPPTPSGSSSDFFSAVSCTSETFCMVLGSADTDYSETWNGSSWSIWPMTPAQGLPSVSCVSSTFCMSVGYQASGTVAEEWDGSSWSLVSSPTNPANLELEPNSVSCVTTQWCKGVGAGYINGTLHTTALAETWNGSSWTLDQAPSPTSFTGLSGVSCSDVNTCMAVGFDGSALSELWHGGSWQVESIPPLDSGRTGNLQAVSCATSGFCSAVGYSAGVLGPPYFSFGESWNGSAWSEVPTPDPLGSGYSVLQAIACTATQLCTAVGRWYGTEPGNPNSATTPNETLTETIAGQVLGIGRRNGSRPSGRWVSDRLE